MPIGALAPLIRYVVLDADGSPSPGAKAYFYLSGTDTPQPVYSNAALTVAHTNPVVADADGVLAPIYFAAVNYRVLITDADGVTIYPATDDVYDFGQVEVPALIAASINNGICDGRLTLTTGTPVTTGDVTAATTVYFTPYQGNRIALYDGSAWDVLTFAQLSIALGSDAANTNYDVFAYNNAGAVAIERLAWTNATTRATGIELLDGIYVKTGDSTRRYLGTYRTTGTIGQTEDSLTKRYVWNYSHRVDRVVRRLEGTDSWTYTTATVRQANGSASNQVEAVIGVAEVAINLRLNATAQNSSTNYYSVGIGEDATDAFSTACVTGWAWGPNDAGTQYVSMSSSLTTYPTVGYHYYTWLEYSEASGTTTWYGDAGGLLVKSGLIGSIQG